MSASLGQFGKKLHRLPQHQARYHDQDADHHDAKIKQLLNGVVVREIVVTKTKSQRLADCQENFAKRNWEQFAPPTSAKVNFGE
jgi:hypothetical protein